MGGVAVGLRLLAAIALANLVTMTTRLDDLVAIVVRLAAPFERFGVNRRGLGLAVALVVRFTPVLAQKAGWLLESWRGRSTRRPGWRIVLPIAAIALDDADHVAEALRPAAESETGRVDRIGTKSRHDGLLRRVDCRTWPPAEADARIRGAHHGPEPRHHAVRHRSRCPPRSPFRPAVPAAGGARPAVARG